MCPPYLSDIKTALYSPRLAAIIRFFNFFSDGNTSKAGGSGKKENGGIGTIFTKCYKVKHTGTNKIIEDMIQD